MVAIRERVEKFSILLTLLTCVTPASTYVSFCYYTAWSASRPNPSARLAIDDIDPHLCTHLLYAFANIDQNAKSVVADNPSQEYVQGGLYAQFNQLKQRNPSLKTLLSVGGAAGSDPFVPISSSTDSIAQFSRNTATFLRTHGFDGLDVDWEYPVQATKSKYSALLKGLREEFNKDSGDGRPLMLTAAVTPGESRVKAGYDIPEISRYLDYILIMTYDFSGPWSDVTGFDSPLLARGDLGFTEIYNVDYAVQLWKNASESGKVVLGMTGAGANFNLTNSNNHGVGAPVSGGGPPGELYGLAGHLVYPEICTDVNNGWTRVWDDKQQVPYAYNSKHWVGYDDQQSIKRKALYAIAQKLGGVMFWELSFDDPTNICKQGKFPLLNVVKKTLNITADVVTTDVTQGTTAGAAQTTPEGATPGTMSQSISVEATTTSASEKIADSSVLFLCSSGLALTVMMFTVV